MGEQSKAKFASMHFCLNRKFRTYEEEQGFDDWSSDNLICT